MQANITASLRYWFFLWNDKCSSKNNIVTWRRVCGSDLLRRFQADSIDLFRLRCLTFSNSLSWSLTFWSLAFNNISPILKRYLPISAYWLYSHVPFQMAFSMPEYSSFYFWLQFCSLIVSSFLIQVSIVLGMTPYRRPSSPYFKANWMFASTALIEPYGAVLENLSAGNKER